MSALSLVYSLAQVWISSCIIISHAASIRENDIVSSVRLSGQDIQRQNHSSSNRHDSSINFSTILCPTAEEPIANFSYPTPIFLDDVWRRIAYDGVVRNKSYYHGAIWGFGVSNFVSYAAYFCNNEAQAGKTEIVSVGSGDGSVEEDIIAAYRDHFGTTLRITLVDLNPNYTVDFKTVSDLIEKRPNVVGNCVLLIIWPEPQNKNNNFDIDAIRKLQPRAVLTLYENTGVSGSVDFQVVLGDKNNEEHQRRWGSLERTNLGLDNYEIEEVAYQRVNLRAGKKMKFPGAEGVQEPGTRVYGLRMVKLKRIED